MFFYEVPKKKLMIGLVNMLCQLFPQREVMVGRIYRACAQITLQMLINEDVFVEKF